MRLISKLFLLTCVGVSWQMTTSTVLLASASDSVDYFLCDAEALHYGKPTLRYFSGIFVGNKDRRHDYQSDFVSFLRGRVGDSGVFTASCRSYTSAKEAERALDKDSEFFRTIKHKITFTEWTAP